MGKGIAKVHQTYSFPRIKPTVEDASNLSITNEDMTTYPHCGFNIMDVEPKGINYVETLEGELMTVSRDEYPNGVNFYIDNMGNMIVYTDDETFKNFSIDEMGNVIYTTP